MSTKLDILDTPGFIQPLKKNSNVPKDILSEVSSKDQSLTVSEKTLWSMEKQARQLTCSWSAIRWTHRAIRQVLDDEDRSEEEKWGDLDAILQAQADLEPLMEDLITTGLTNSVLRRHDLLLEPETSQSGLVPVGPGVSSDPGHSTGGGTTSALYVRLPALSGKG